LLAALILITVMAGCSESSSSTPSDGSEGTVDSAAAAAAIAKCDKHVGLRQLIETNIGHIAQCNDTTPDGGYWGFPY
jgi:hypothetical protein